MEYHSSPAARAALKPSSNKVRGWALMSGLRLGAREAEGRLLTAQAAVGYPRERTAPPTAPVADLDPSRR